MAFALYAIFLFIYGPCYTCEHLSVQKVLPEDVHKTLIRRLILLQSEAVTSETLTLRLRDITLLTCIL